MYVSYVSHGDAPSSSALAVDREEVFSALDATHVINCQDLLPKFNFVGVGVTVVFSF